VSGVLVDVCKNDGVWFDAGEIGKTIAFIEAGGLGRSRAFAQQRARQTAEADRHAWEKAREPVLTGNRFRDGWAEDRQGRLLLDALHALFS
jgi:Zn-finger nucleic acid-binding protein